MDEERLVYGADPGSTLVFTAASTKDNKFHKDTFRYHIFLRTLLDMKYITDLAWTDIQNTTLTWALGPHMQRR